jgi:hypothetical protein
LLHRSWDDDAGELCPLSDDDDEWDDIRNLDIALDGYRPGGTREGTMTEKEWRFWFTLTRAQEPEQFGEMGPTLFRPLTMALCEVERPDCILPVWARELTGEELEQLEKDKTKILEGEIDDVG